MFYRLIQGGTLPIWYGFNCRTTYVLEPGLLADPEMGRKWISTQQDGESDNDLAERVGQQLAQYYTSGDRGYSIFGSSNSSQHGLATLGRRVDRHEAARLETDHIIGDWTRGLFANVRPQPSSPPANSRVSPASLKRSAETQDDLDATPTRATRSRRVRRTLSA